MKFQLTLFLQFVLLSALYVSQHNCLPTTTSVESTEQETNAITGNDVTWVYDTDGTRRYMNLQYGHATQKTVYNFTLESGTDRISISYMASTTKTYLYIDPTTKMLSITTNQTLRQIFQIIPVQRSDTLFRIHINSTEPLVSLPGGSRTEFYPYSEFPSEHVAQFYIFPSTVVKSYDGKLANIPITIERIRHGDYGDNVTAYQSLLTQMTTNNHHLEHELFTVGICIKQDSGVNSAAYRQLPLQAQLILSGDPVTLYYRRSATVVYPMVYHRADDVADTFPFVFNYYLNTTTGVYTWSITTVATASEHQLYIWLTNLMQRQGEKEYLFKFKLVAGIQEFRIFTPINYPLFPQQSSPPFTFYEYNSSLGALFYVQKESRESTLEN